MGMYRVSGSLAQDSARAAETFAKYNVWHELKKNGSLWVSDSHCGHYHAISVKLHCLCRDLGINSHLNEVFDHPRYYMRNDKSVAVFMNPYGSEREWTLITEHAHEAGLRITKLPEEDWLYSPGCNTYMIEEIEG